MEKDAMDIDKPATDDRSSHAELIKDKDYGIILVNDEKHLFTQITKQQKVRMSNRDTHVPIGAFIGHPFGSFFEFRQGKFYRIEKKPEVSLYKPESGDVTGDNRNLVDQSANQTLSSADIAKLKEQGQTGQEIIQALVASLGTFDGKTAFSQEKYIKKKQAKYLTIVQVVKPTSLTLCQAYFDKTPNKVAGLRPDTLSQILLHSNVHSGSNVQLFDECGGMLLGSLVERLGGSGNLVNIHPGDFPSLGVMQFFNLPREHHSVCLNLSVAKIKSLLYGGEDINEKLEEEDLSSLPEDEAKAIMEKKRIRIERRRASDAKAKAVLDLSFDSLVIGTKRDPSAILEALFPFLGQSMPFVVYCPFQEPLAALHHKLNKAEAAVHLTLSETWMRIYQVLPKRTHPMMGMSGSGGYILHGYKIRSTFGQNSLASLSLTPETEEEGDGNDRPNKKQKTEDE